MDDPTLDPVERERRLLAESLAEGAEGKESARGLTLLSKLAVLVSVALVAVYLAVWANAVQNSGGPEGYVRATDFVPVFTGGLILHDGNGQLLYDLDLQRLAESRVLASSNAKITFFDRTPFEALLVAPFVGMPPWVAFAAWTLAAGLALGLAVGLLDGALPVSRPVGWALSLAACSYLPAIRALMLGQDSLFVLMGLGGTYLALKRQREGWAAVAMLLVALRPQVLPAVLLVLLLQGYWKTLVGFGALLVVFVVGAMSVLGAQWPVQYLQFLFRPTGGGDWIPGLATPLFVVVSLAAFAALAWGWLRSRDIPADEEFLPYDERFDLVWALAGVVAALTSLYLNPQDLTLLIFPAWIIGAYATLGLWGAGLSRFWLVLLWIGYALAPLSLYWSANGANPTLTVVPSVVLLCIATALLAWQASSPEPKEMTSS